ncbi:alpha-hydroxy acid oxidase [Sphingopyxis sp. 113P3]|jgi:L-lactate dehydrogenase (FMN-dependent) and related alpha-hydroxy acid dehydrogenases|uniref:alpha-hydroxy acid oxidase n=1 Tax=Sphingopyxis sp. (strain 113P3) TaxID=292913 RepID=UPI0006AD413A|nr:alpha-hydroxy acid oxidase [Sphingopyxis sp. 113P3]ALC11903.1 L-lactate dehydrogenase (cytochrome) [Sphingopyxis sp. 113P3]
MPRLTQCYGTADYEVAARRRLPRPLFDYICGAADDEKTAAANVESFDRYDLVPRYLADVTKVSAATRVLGCDLAWPLILAPTGMSRMFHPDGELGVAQAAADAGCGYALSTMATTSIEDIGAATTGPKIYQLYLLADDALNFASIDRCKAAGFDALCITVDTIVAGNRERDLRSGLTVPPRLSPSSLAAFVKHPGWCLGYLGGGKFSLPNVTAGGEGDLSTLASFFASKMEPHISWERIEKIAAYWDGPFAIKGLQSSADACRAADSGATAVIISNHGGRQLDGGAATIDLIADIVDAVGDRVEVILDGGIRRGSHILKAIAMGARACMTGRPYLYALSAFGAEGVQRWLGTMQQETVRTMALLGCRSLPDIGRDHVRLASAAPAFLSGDAERRAD